MNPKHNAPRADAAHANEVPAARFIVALALVVFAFGDASAQQAQELVEHESHHRDVKEFRWAEVAHDLQQLQPELVDQAHSLNISAIRAICA